MASGDDAPAAAGEWRSVDSTVGVMLNDVWGSGPDDVVAVGEYGTVIRWDSERFRAEDSGVSLDLDQVCGFDADDVWAVGSDVVLHRTEDRWREVDPGVTDGFRLHLACGPERQVWVTDEYGPAAHRYQAGSWNHWTFDDFYPAVACVAGPRDVWLMESTDDAFAHFDGVDFTIVEHRLGSLSFEGAWASGPNDVWLVGLEDDVAAAHWDGTRWRAQPFPDVGYSWDVWGLSASLVLVSGEMGRLLVWDGTEWKAAIGIDYALPNLLGVWADREAGVWAVGPRGTVLRTR